MNDIIGSTIHATPKGTLSAWLFADMRFAVGIAVGCVGCVALFLGLRLIGGV